MLPHRGSDLLDVMRTPSAPKHLGGFGRGPAASGGGAGGRFTPRGLFLGGAALSLAVVLAFVVGMALGKRGGARNPTSDLALARPSISSWVIRGWVPSVSPTTTERLETAIPKDLALRAPGLSNRVRVARDDSRREGTLTVVIGGFPTPEDAQRALDALATWSVESCFPFRRGVVEPAR